MAGAKTRFGFSGSGSEPPDSDQVRTARTVIGRDIHLQMPANVEAASRPPPSVSFPAASSATPRTPISAPRPAVPVYRPEEDTAELPSRRDSRPRGSRFARFLGRWTESGRFVSNHVSAGAQDPLNVPRGPLARNILLMLGVALVTFSLTFLVVKLRQRFADEATPISAPVQQPSPRAAPSAPPQK